MSLSAWGIALGIGCRREQALKARFIQFFCARPNVNRAFSANPFLDPTDPGALPRQAVEPAPLALNTGLRKQGVNRSQRENLDSKLIAFSMLALCNEMLG
jgi:hypothetical protein